MDPDSSEIRGVGNTPLVALKKVPKHSDLACQIYAKLEFLNTNKTIYDRLALALVSKAESAGIIEPGSTVIFGPDPEFCFSLLNICNSKQYKLVALVPKTMITTRLINDLKNFGATICPLPDNSNSANENDMHRTNEITRLGRVAFDKAKQLADSENAINLMDFVLTHADVFHSEIDKLIQEIVTSGIVPDLFVGEMDHFGIINRMSHKLPQKFPTCQIYGIASDVYSVGQKATDFNRPCDIPATKVVSI